MTQEERAIKVKSIITDDFLNQLTEIAKLYGWQGDYTEIIDFVRNCHGVVNRQAPDLTPYEIED